MNREGGSLLKKTFPATAAQKHLLNFQPAQSRCRLKADVQTIANCLNVIVFVWLTDGNGYWYYMKRTWGNLLIGYVLIHNRWNYHPIEKGRIVTYF